MTPIRFHPEAESEMIAAALYYESQQKDLGKRFLSVLLVSGLNIGTITLRVVRFWEKTEALRFIFDPDRTVGVVGAVREKV